MDGVVQRSGKGPAALLVPFAVPQAIAQGHGIIIPGDGVFLQVVRRVDQIHPPAQVVEHLLQHPPPHRVLHPGSRCRQQLGKGICRLIHGGTTLPLQAAQSRQLFPHPAVKLRPGRGSLSIAAPQCGGGDPVAQPLPEAVVLHAVLQLPVGQNHALIRCQLQGRGCGLVRPEPDGAGHAPPPAGCSFFRIRQQDGQIGEVVVQDHPGRRAVPLPQGVAQPAVCPPEPLCLLLRQDLQRGAYIAEHRLRTPGRC